MAKKNIFNLQKIKKVAPLVLICAAIIILCRQALFIHYNNIARGNKSDLVYKLESSLLDFRFNMRGEEKPNKKVGILAIDEKTIQTFGRWPFSRRFYKRALENLKKAGVKWIGFDVIFSEPEIASLADAKAYLDVLKNSKSGQVGYNLSKAMDGIAKMEKLAPGDAAFARGIKEFENIVLGFFYMQSKFEMERSGVADDPFKNIDSMENSAIEMIIFPDDEMDLSNYSDSSLNVSAVVSNIPALGSSTDYFAFFSNEPDEDAIVRSASMVTIANDTLYPSLSLKLAAEAMDRDIVVFFNEIGVESIALVNREDDSDSVDVPVDFYGRGRVLINHKGPGYETFPHISLADAWTGDFSEEAKKFLPGSVLYLVQLQQVQMTKDQVRLILHLTE
jgi:adenylate cyclase